MNIKLHNKATNIPKVANTRYQNEWKPENIHMYINLKNAHEKYTYKYTDQKVQPDINWSL